MYCLIPLYYTFFRWNNQDNNRFFDGINVLPALEPVGFERGLFPIMPKDNRPDLRLYGLQQQYDQQYESLPKTTKEEAVIRPLLSVWVERFELSTS